MKREEENSPPEANSDGNEQNDATDDPNGNGSGVSKGSFRRAKSRASRACEVCHARKVRCDVTVHMPCTNCAAFGCECRIPEVKARKSSKNVEKQKKKEKSDSEKPSISSRERPAALPQASTKIDGSSETAPPEISSNVALSDNSNMPQYEISNEAAVAAATRLKKKQPKQFTSSDEWNHLLNSNVKGAGRVAFMGSTTNLNLLLEDHTESYHYSLPDDSGRSRLSEIEKEEVDILKIRGAFLLPSRELCDDIVESYFEKIHPIIPLVNRTQFMRQYNDPSNPPSLLLLQAILLAGSRVCGNPALQDASGSSELASLTFYKRAKALFDANYETDRIAIVQSTALLGWWWENPEELTKNIFYWTRVAIAVAQGFGMHRSVETSDMDLPEKKMWKRIWWALFLRDRYIAIGFGRPFIISLEDCDVPMITEEDLNEDEPGRPSPYPQNRVHSLCFIHSIKLAEIIGYVLKQQFTVGAEKSRRQNKLPNIAHCDMAMASWMKNLPEELKYSVQDKRNHDFFKGLLHSQYYTVLCLVHRSNIVHRPNGYSVTTATQHNYPSWGIAFQAAHMISMIFENMRAFKELRETPATAVYNLFSSMITLLYQAESPSKSASERAQIALASNLESMREVGKTWIVGRMIVRLYEHLQDDPKIKAKIILTAKKIGARVDSTLKSLNLRPLDDKSEKRGAEDGSEFEPPAKRRASSVARSPKDFSHPSHQQKSTVVNGAGSPDFYFVTNTPPSTGSFVDNFQPSQLFPDMPDLSLFQNSSQSVTPAESLNTAITTPSNAHLQRVSGSGLDLYKSSSPEDTSGAPSTLNIGDWYQFLLNNSDNNHLLDVNAMMTALGGADTGDDFGAPPPAPQPI